MSRGDLQEMEVGTKQSKTACQQWCFGLVILPCQKRLTMFPTTVPLRISVVQPPRILNQTIILTLKTPTQTIKQVKDVVNKGAKPAEPMKST